ncbi:MAG: hypothetical protein LUQ40_03615 [Methanomicrobiales archaeon]|nr:hypothetical protein [Methanomicrobiales archaeon]
MRKIVENYYLFSVIILVAVALFAGCAAESPAGPECSVESITDFLPHLDEGQYTTTVQEIFTNNSPQLFPYFQNREDFVPNVVRGCRAMYTPRELTVTKEGLPIFLIEIFEFNSPQNAEKGMQIAWDDYALRSFATGNVSVIRNNVKVSNFVHEGSIDNGTPVGTVPIRTEYFFWNKDRYGFILLSGSGGAQSSPYNAGIMLVDEVMRAC